MAARWAELGLDWLDPRARSVEERDGARGHRGRVTGAGDVVRHRQAITPVEGGVRVDEQAVLPDEFDDVPRVGSVFEVGGGRSAGFLGWFGGGRWSRTPTGARRRPSACTGAGRRALHALSPAAGERRPARRTPVRARVPCRRRGPEGCGAEPARVELDEPRQAWVTRYRARGPRRGHAPRRAGAAARGRGPPRRRSPRAGHGVVRARHPSRVPAAPGGVPLGLRHPVTASHRMLTSSAPHPPPAGLAARECTEDGQRPSPWAPGRLASSCPLRRPRLTSAREAPRRGPPGAPPYWCR